MQTVGVIGLGLLGTALAERIGAAGFPVRGFDIDPVRCAAAAETGIRITVSAAAAASDIVVTCLPDGPAVSRVAFDEGLAGALTGGAVLVDCTTCAPSEARQLSCRLGELGIACLDAPVSGSSGAVRAGEAVVLVGGAAEVVERCRPVLGAIATRVFHVGGSGAGAAAKLVSNLVLGLNRLALAEGLALSERLGMDPAVTLEVLRTGAAYSRALDAKGERMLGRLYEPDARLSQHLKDVELIVALGEETGAPLPVSAIHREILLRALELGYGDSDNSAVIEVFRTSSP